MARNKKKRERRDGFSIIIVILIISMTAFTLAAVFSSSVATLSPEIFIYTDEPVTCDISVRIEGGVTKTIPDIPLGKEVTWKNVHIDHDGALRYQGEEYPFLYYEGNFEYGPSNYGWLIEKIDGQMFLDGSSIDEAGLMSFLEGQFVASGLYQQEISVLLNRIAENDMPEFAGQYLCIRFIPVEDVDKVIKISTSHDFSIMRRHFLIQEMDEKIELQDPSFETVENDGLLIHEIAINRI